jgi:hypothetical protein
MENIEQYKKRFFNLMESTMGDAKPLITEDSMESKSLEGRNNPDWVNLVNKLRNLSFSPKILTFNSYDTPSTPSQSLNWGTAKSTGGKYALSIASTDSKMPKERMILFNSEDREKQTEMHNWWINKGYKTDGRSDISINFKDADKLRNDIESFFKIYPPM